MQMTIAEAVPTILYDMDIKNENANNFSEIAS